MEILTIIQIFHNEKDTYFKRLLVMKNKKSKPKEKQKKRTSVKKDMQGFFNILLHGKGVNSFYQFDWEEIY